MLDFMHDVHAMDDFTEDDVLVVEVGGRQRRDEELAAVGIGAGVLRVVRFVVSGVRGDGGIRG